MTSHKQRSPRPHPRDPLPWLWGMHPVTAALQNKQRTCHVLMGTREALQSCATLLENRPKLTLKTVSRDELDRSLPPQALHQGIAVQVSPLPTLFLDAFLRETPHAKRLVVLDQITDPHNLGAILRSACAFQMEGVLLTLRHSPPLEGVVAKSASGALDRIPLLWTTNLAHGLQILKKTGFWCIGLTETGPTALSQAPQMERLALVLGAEGRGLRPLTAERCDLLVHLPTNPDFPTLNVSAAAAVAFYHLSTLN